jgi:hypothetical protein
VEAGVHPLRAAAREAEGVVADWYQPTLQRAAGDDPWAAGGDGEGGGSPVGADLVDVEVVGVGVQPAGDLPEEIGGEGGPAAAGHRVGFFLSRRKKILRLYVWEIFGNELLKLNGQMLYVIKKKLFAKLLLRKKNPSLKKLYHWI